MGRVVVARVASVAGLVALLMSLAHEPAVARADDVKGSTSTIVQACNVKGSAPVPKDTLIYDAKSAGKALAKFSGASTPISMSDFPSDPANGRAKIATSNGGSSLRIEGWSAPTAFTFYTTKDIAVVASHVWIASAQKVAIVAASNGQLTAELKVAGSNAQTVKATAACDAFSFSKPVATTMDVSGSARGYLTKSTSTEIFDAPNGTSILTLKMSEATGQLFWSTEQKSGFVHVLSRGDISIDGWVRSSALEPLKKGEMMDQLAAPSTVVTGAQLALDKPPPLAKATKDVAVRSTRDVKAATIGVIEKDAEVYLMETVAGWVNVLPKGLGVMPADESVGFWIPAGEAPAVTKTP